MSSSNKNSLSLIIFFENAFSNCNCASRKEAMFVMFSRQKEAMFVMFSCQKEAMFVMLSRQKMNAVLELFRHNNKMRTNMRRLFEKNVILSTPK